MAEPKEDMTVPSFDEGERKPSPITATSDDGVRRPIPSNPVEETAHTADDRGMEPTATMPPDQAGKKERNSM